MRVMLPKGVLERFLDGPFQYEELQNRVSAYVGEKLTGQDANSNPFCIGQIDESEGEDEDANAVQQRRPQDRSNQKHKQEPDNERRPFNRRTANSSPSALRQSTPRETRKTGAMRRKRVRERRSVCNKCGGKGYPASLCPSADDCQDVDEVGTEPSSDADRDLFGLDCGDDPITTTNSVTERKDRTRGGKDFMAVVDSSAVDNVPSKLVCTEYHLEATSKSQSGVSFKGANGSHIKHYGQRRFRVKTWKQYEHHSGGSRCAQSADLRQPSA